MSCPKLVQLKDSTAGELKAYWGTEGPGGTRLKAEQQRECGSGRRKVKPILPTTPSRSTDRTTSRTNLTRLKPAEDIFFSFFLSSFPPEFLLPFCPCFFFYSFFLPSFTFFIPSARRLLLISFILISVEIPSSYLSSNIFYSFFLPSFHSFSIPFPPPSFLLFSPLLSLFPTGETIKPGILKRPELDRVRPINIS